MKKRRLIIANTFYQVIFAIQMKLTIFKEDCVEIIITDHSKNAEHVASKLKDYNVFNNVNFVNTFGSADNRNKLQKACDVFCISFLKNNSFCYYTKKMEVLFFDEMIVFNYDMRVYGIFSVLSYHNYNLKLSRYEEGILSYSTETLFSFVRKTIGQLRKLQKKAVIEEAFFDFYCFYPSLYHGILSAKEVPLIKRNGPIKHILQEVFDVNENDIRYSQKYIFFTSVYDFEGGEPIGEYDLVCQIAELVGKENVLVKTHPRDTRSIYIDNGFCVDKNSAIPWEVIQLSGDFSDRIFMTINSGSVLAGSFMSEKPVKTYYMYELCDMSHNVACQKSAAAIKALVENNDMKDILSEVYIADNIEDILYG